MPTAEKVRAGPRDFYVLVRWIELEKKYEGFLLSGRQAREAVTDSCRSQSVRIRKGTRKVEFPCVHVGPGNAEVAARWAAAWLKWRKR